MGKDVQGEKTGNVRTARLVGGIALIVLGIPMMFSKPLVGAIFIALGAFMLAHHFKNEGKKGKKTGPAGSNDQASGLMLFFLAAGAILSAPHAAFAFIQPASGSMGYNVYSTTQSIYVGAIGYSCAAAAVGWGIHELIKTRIWGMLGSFGAAAILANLDKVLISMGMVR